MTRQSGRVRQGVEAVFHAVPGYWLTAWVVVGGWQAWAAPVAPAPGNGVVTLPGTNAVSAAQGLRDIRPPVDIPSGWVWLWRTLFVLAVAALGWLAWRQWQKRRQSVPGEESVPPSQTARERLREALSLIDQPQPFCFGITEILRTYLEQQFGLNAPERTTEEFLAELQQSLALDRRHKEVLEDFLTRCDLVKFAKVEPGRAELEELHAAALRLVDETAGWRPPSQHVLLPDRVQVDTGAAMARAGAAEDGGAGLTGDARYMPRDQAGKTEAAAREVAS